MSSRYARAWRQYARRRNAVIGAAISVFAFMAVPPAVAKILAFPWLAICLWTTVRVNLFRCPRCGNTFFFKFPVCKAFARRCLHCGLRKWAEDDQ